MDLLSCRQGHARRLHSDCAGDRHPKQALQLLLAATDGESVCAIFANGNLVCLDMDGTRKWARNLGTPDNV